MDADRYLPHEAEAYFAETGLPFVTLTYAQTLDGSIALTQGVSAAISGPDSLKVTHQLRGAHDGILVGIGTVLADNPRLTARNGEGNDPQPIVLDTNLRFPSESKLYKHPKGVWIATSSGISPEAADHFREKRAELLVVKRNQSNQIDLHDLLMILGKRDIRSLMVEGGAGVITSFLRARLVNRVVLTIAPAFAGGYKAVKTLDLSDRTALPRLKEMNTLPAGDDLIVWGDLI